MRRRRAKDSSYERASTAQNRGFEVDAVVEPSTDPRRFLEPCSSNGSSRDKNPGYGISLQNPSYVSDLHRNHKSCSKHPRHEYFIPVNNFCVNHLPEGLKNPRLVELIRLKGEFTVRLIILHTSRRRPKGLEVNIPQNGTRVGTGTVFLHKIENSELCNCNQIKGKHSISGPFLVMTAGHVVFDDEEARNTYIEFFFDSEDRSGIVEARGHRVVEIHIEGNRSIFECRTHNLNLYRRLKENHEQRQKLIEGGLERMVSDMQTVVVISHPHGASKHVTVGTLQEKNFVGTDIRTTDDGMKLRECILKYDVPTCPGSGGGSVNVIGGGATVSAFAPHCSSKVGHGNISGIGWAREK